jgi:hypothetical protein
VFYELVFRQQRDSRGANSTCVAGRDIDIRLVGGDEQ